MELDFVAAGFSLRYLCAKIKAVPIKGTATRTRQNRRGLDFVAACFMPAAVLSKVKTKAVPIKRRGYEYTALKSKGKTSAVPIKGTATKSKTLKVQI